MSPPLQRGSRRVSDGGNPSDLQRDDKDEEGADRARSLGSKLEITSLLKLWNRMSSLNLSEDHGKANLEEESRSGSDLCGQPLPSKRLESGASFLILKSGLVVVFLLALCWSLWWTLAISSIPTVSFYRNYRRLQEQVREDFSDIGELSLGLTKVRELDFCPPELEDNVPCFNASAISQEGSTESEQFDRLCNLNSNQSCLILPPKDYRIPLRWPTGRDVIWSMNVKITAEEVASSRSLTRRMMMLEDNQISFGSETLFVDGIEDYSHQIAEMIGLPNESYLVNAGVRTVLDIGCGYGSFGAYLFSKELLTLCIANYEVSGSQVQLTLERGLPAIIGSFGLKQLPYPFLSFDMVHCARCGVEWDQKGGSFLIEADRVLKPGGYFVWTSPVTNPHRSARDKENFKKWNFVRDFTENLCWDLLSQQDETVVWKQ